MLSTDLGVYSFWPEDCKYLVCDYFGRGIGVRGGYWDGYWVAHSISEALNARAALKYYFSNTSIAVIPYNEGGVLGS
jgi:hypothetical protein